MLFSSSRERKRARARDGEESKGRGGRNTHKKNSSPQIFVRRNPKKKIKNTRERRVLSPGTEKTTKKTIPRLERERGSAREEERWASSHCTRTTHDFIMALRQTLKQFTSKTTAFAPLLSRASGVQMYSTVIEGLKYASSHEWYVRTNSFSHQSLFWVNFRFGFPPFVVFGNTFFCFLSLSSVSLSLCDVYISYAHRVNESEGDEFGRRKREREREKEM